MGEAIVGHGQYDTEKAIPSPHRRRGEVSSGSPQDQNFGSVRSDTSPLAARAASASR
jgi:hypothetical protein